MPRTAKQTAAARVNGRMSQGPRTGQGKAASAQNAVRHGLTSAHVCLAGEDRTDWAALRADYHADWQPATRTEHDLIDELAATRWRWHRARRSETALFDRHLLAKQDWLNKNWRNLELAGRIALTLDYNPRRLQAIQTHLVRLSRAWHRALRTLQQRQTERRPQNAQNEPEQAQPQPGQELTPTPLAADPAPSPSAPPDSGLLAVVADRGDHVLATRHGQLIAAEPSVADLLRRVREQHE